MERISNGVLHILANQLLVTGHYEDDGGTEKLEAFVRSIHGDIEIIVFHDNQEGIFWTEKERR